jgi:NADP-dependent 3-hydroxy acid dehydrogenase YdfG
MTTAETRRTILVTGATSGIGKATALRLAAAGHRVFATGRNAQALAELAGHDGITTLVLDVCDGASIAAAVRAVDEATHGRGLDVLVNNAGFGIVAPLVEIDEEDLRRQFDTNVFGLLAVTRAFARGMMERGRGTVINVGSVGGRMTLPLMAGYNATKYAVESISDGLRTELHPFGIRVALVEPGVVATRFNATATRPLSRYGGDGSPYAAALEHYAGVMDRSVRFAATPEAIARTIARLAVARRPRARTVAPWTSLLGLWLVMLLPTPLLDAIMRRVGGLRPAPVRASAQLTGAATK